jgi:alanine dehydrogenase
MRVGVLTEIKDKEQRVALTPAGTTTLRQAGHTVRVQAGVGLGAGFPDAQYLAAGALDPTYPRGRRSAAIAP